MNSQSFEMYSVAANELIPRITIEDSEESSEEKEDLFAEFFKTEQTPSNSAPNPVLQQATVMNIMPQHGMIHYDPNQQGMLHPVPEDESDCEIVFESDLQQNFRQGEGLHSLPHMGHAMNVNVDPNVLNNQQVQQDYSYEYADGIPNGSNLQAAGSEIMTAGGPMRKPRRNPPTSDPFSARRKARSKNYKNAPEESSLYLPLVTVDGRTILTENVSKRLVYELGSRGLAQSFFAERVLGIKQSALSEMILEPNRPMRTKGWLNYRKLVTWLQMKEEEKLKILYGGAMFCTSEVEPESVPEPETTNKPAEDAQKEKKSKKARTQFTPEQLTALQSNYKINRYPNKEEKKKMSIQLNLPFQSIDNWFVNTRRRNPIVASEQPADSNTDV